MKKKGGVWSRLAQFLIDAVHLAIIISLFVYTFYAVVADGSAADGDFLRGLLRQLRLAGLNEIFTFVGAVAFILFGIVGVYEFCYANGLRWLPSPYLKFREERDEKAARAMMKTYYQQDLDFIEEYEKERADRILQSLGLEEKQFHHIQYELVRARTLPAGTPEEMEAKLKGLVCRAELIQDLAQVDGKDRVYDGVNYFLDLYSGLYDTRLCADVGGILAAFIAWHMEREGRSLGELDCLLVPSRSNLLLGLEVGKRLQKPVIFVQERERARIRKDRPWDGNYDVKPGETRHAVIVHDILVSGGQILEAKETMAPFGCEVDGLFCLFRYDYPEKYQPLELLREGGINRVHCIGRISEEELRARKEGGDAP